MKVGDIVWLNESGHKRQVVVRKLTRSDAIVQFTDTGGGIRVSLNRLYETEESADRYLFERAAKAKETGIEEKYIRKKNQYDYM